MSDRKLNLIRGRCHQDRHKKKGRAWGRSRRLGLRGFVGSQFSMSSLLPRSQRISPSHTAASDPCIEESQLLYEAASMLVGPAQSQPSFFLSWCHLPSTHVPDDGGASLESG